MCILSLCFSSSFLKCVSCMICSFFFFKQKTAYEMRISDWSSDVCSSDLPERNEENGKQGNRRNDGNASDKRTQRRPHRRKNAKRDPDHERHERRDPETDPQTLKACQCVGPEDQLARELVRLEHEREHAFRHGTRQRSEEHTSELPSLMRTSYA